MSRGCNCEVAGKSLCPHRTYILVGGRWSIDRDTRNGIVGHSCYEEKQSRGFHGGGNSMDRRAFTDKWQTSSYLKLRMEPAMHIVRKRDSLAVGTVSTKATMQNKPGLFKEQ